MRSPKMMKLKASAIALASIAIAIAGWALAASAGVAIQAQELAVRTGGPSPSNGAGASPYTAMIEGEQEKFLIGTLAVVVDLAAGKVSVLNPRRGTYFQLPYPPPAVFGQLILRRILPPKVKYIKGGQHQTLAGHGCDLYTGTGQVNGAAVSVEACYSTDAPGAQEYTAFVKSAAPKAENPSFPTADEFPQGIPLELDATVIPKQQPESPAASTQKPVKPEQPATTQKPVVIKLKTTVTSVETRSIAATEFQTGKLKFEQPPKGIGRAPIPFEIKPLPKQSQ